MWQRGACMVRGVCGNEVHNEGVVYGKGGVW